MITPTMTALEAVRDARQDLRALVHKVLPICKRQEHKHRKERDRKCLLQTRMAWRSPRGNNWLLVLTTNKHETTVSSLAWFRGTDLRLRAVQPNLATTDTLYYSAHLLERYVQRFDPGRDPMQRLQDFFFANHHAVRQPLRELGNGKWEVMTGLYHGLATGEHDSATGLTTLTTFLDYGMLGAEQQVLADYLDFLREMHTYPKGFREHVLRLIEEDKRKRAA